MLVRTHNKGLGQTGLQVGAQNVRRFFSKDNSEVELLLDHLLIQLSLNDDFWQGEAEIFDPRLCAWLESKNFPLRPCHAPVQLALIPVGKNSFRLTTVAKATLVH
ncbi:hypothetical protein ACOBR2_17655 [Telmatobacter bradus]|uniref:hypothetical protein n=1 Tax=Telmatobacter bradus TaxID=474953 RepID=UPI003B43A1CA